MPRLAASLWGKGEGGNLRFVEPVPRSAGACPAPPHPPEPGGIIWPDVPEKGGVSQGRGRPSRRGGDESSGNPTLWKSQAWGAQRGGLEVLT